MKKYKNDPNLYFDYRDTKTLQRFIDSYGHIEPISKTGLSAKQQRQLAVAIRRNYVRTNRSKEKYPYHFRRPAV